MDLSTLGKRIAYYRKRIGLRQKALAASVGVSPNAVCLYEQGGRNPPIPTLINIARALRITVDTLLGLDLPEGGRENTLLCAYRNLNKLGKERVLEIVTGLEEIPKFTERKDPRYPSRPPIPGMKTRHA